MILLPFHLVLTAASPALAASKFRNPDEKRDWHGINWGTTPADDMICVSSPNPGVQVCTRPPASGDHAVGDLKVDTVSYLYFQDHLYRVDLGVTSDDVAGELGRALRQLYGPGTWDAGERSEGWKGSQIAISMVLGLRKPGAVLSYQYRSLVTDVDAARVAAGGEKLTKLLGDL